MIGFGLLVNTIGLFFEPISHDLAASRASVSLMTTLQNAAAAIALVFAGKIMSKYNLRYLLAICFAVIALALLSLTKAQALWQFYLAWTLIGLFQPFAITLAIPVLLSNWFENKLGTVMGIALGLSALGGTIFNPVISAVITAWGWRQGFLVEGLIILIILLPASLSLRQAPAVQETKATQETAVAAGISLKEAVKQPAFYCLALAMFALQFVSGSVQHVSGHIVNLGLSLNTGATVVSGVMLGAMLGKIIIGYLLDHWSTAGVVLLFAALGAAGWLGQIFFKQASLLIATAFVLGLGQGLCLVGLPYLISKRFGQRDYANILSVINMVGAVAMSISVGLDGALFDWSHSYTFPWLINFAAYCLSLLLLEFMLKGQQAKSKF